MTKKPNLRQQPSAREPFRQNGTRVTAYVSFTSVHRYGCKKCIKSMYPDPNVL